MTAKQTSGGRFSKKRVAANGAPYTDREIRKLLKLMTEPGGKTFTSMEAFLRHLREL